MGVPGLSAIVERADRLQRRWRPLAVAYAVVKRYGEDRGGRLVALLSYYGFLSLFPLLLALTTLLGIVLEDDPDLRERLLDSVLGQIPVVGRELGDNVQGVGGSGMLLVLGLLGALWSGLAVLDAAQETLNTIWGLPRRAHPGFVQRRLRGLAALGLLAIGVVAMTAATMFGATVDGLAVLGPLLAAVAVAVVGGALLVAARRILVAVPLPTRALVPGSIAGGVGLAVVHVAGAVYVEQVVRGASDTYGTFAVVLGLIAFVSLVMTVFVVTSVLDVVLAKRLWPRSLVNDNAADPCP